MSAAAPDLCRLQPRSTAGASRGLMPAADYGAFCDRAIDESNVTAEPGRAKVGNPKIRLVRSGAASTAIRRSRRPGG